MTTMPVTDDLFERNTMSFGEHLEHLRFALIKACLWLAVGSGIGLYFSEHVVQWISAPFRQQLRQYHIDRVAGAYTKLFGTQPPSAFVELMHKQQVIPRAGYVMEGSEFDHSLDFQAAGELNRHAWQQSLAEGRLQSVKRQVWLDPIPDSLNSFGIFEGFYVYLQASLVIGVALALPGMFWHVWSFVAAGLYPHERRQVYKLLPLSVVLFLAGASLANFVMIELLIRVMLEFNVGLGIEIQPRVKDCFSLAMWLPLIFGLAFQLPLAMKILNALDLVSSRSFIAHQKLALLGITLLSMVLTPADPYTFIGLMLPLIALYYVGIALCKRVGSSELGLRH